MSAEGHGVNVCVIPARGGSERIPRKNVRDFCGRPMLAWPIEAARASGRFDRVVVSTDDAEIADAARRYGAEVPFERPARLADAFTGTRAVLRHAAELLVGDGATLANVACLYATAVLFRPEDVRDAFALLDAHPGAERVTAVTPFPHPIERALRIDEGGRLAMLHPNHATTRSQDLEPTYHDAGQFYLWRAEALLAAADTAPPALALVLPRGRVQDIDTPEDWAVAEALFEHRRRP